MECVKIRDEKACILIKRESNSELKNSKWEILPCRYVPYKEC